MDLTDWMPSVTALRTPALSSRSAEIRYALRPARDAPLAPSAATAASSVWSRSGRAVTRKPQPCARGDAAHLAPRAQGLPRRFAQAARWQTVIPGAVFHATERA